MLNVAELGLTVGTDEALAETHTQTQEEDRCHTAHREEDDRGRTHCTTQTHTLTFTPKRCLRFKITTCKLTTSVLNMIGDAVREK